MMQIHPEIKKALRLSLCMTEEEIERTIKVGNIIFTSQHFLSEVATSFGPLHVRATLDFINKHLGEYQECERGFAQHDRIYLSFFSATEQGREGYSLVLGRKEIIFTRITSVAGIFTNRVITQITV